ncbi:MAG: hypothetical protein ACI379_10000 [Nocardioides sp.]|uniref:hypothetical protein n=1 Tax=Nocardioides sp. TaxID=35761 RepID=UPI003EFCC52C
MRTRVIWASAVAVAVLLSGCAGADDEPAGGGSTPTQASPTEDPDGATPTEETDPADDVLGDEVLDGTGASVRLPVGWELKEEFSVPGMFVQAGPAQPGDGLTGTVAVLDPIPVSGGLDGAARSQIESSINTRYRRIDDVTRGEHSFYRVVAGRGADRSEIHGTVVDGVEYAVQFNLHRAGGARKAEADELIEAVMSSWALS